MARSKNLHYVQHTVTVQQPEDPTQNWVDGVLQIDVNLSEQLGRTIRNGNSFRLVGYGSNLKGYIGASDQDTGFAGTAVVAFTPVTKNSVAAHQGLYKQWMRQKQLAGAVGAYVRYDDFEVGWSDGNKLPAARNSTMLATGLEDTNTESVVLYGNSVGGSAVSLETYYNNLNPVLAPSENPFGTEIKSAKFVDRFPDQVDLIMPTSFSAQVESSWDPDAIVGGIANGDIQWLPSDNHISHMTGTLFYYFKGVTQDTIGPTADELKLTITLVYEGWNSLAPKSSRKSSKKITENRSKKNA